MLGSFHRYGHLRPICLYVLYVFEEGIRRRIYVDSEFQIQYANGRSSQNSSALYLYTDSS